MHYPTLIEFIFDLNPVYCYNVSFSYKISYISTAARWVRFLDVIITS